MEQRNTLSKEESAQFIKDKLDYYFKGGAVQTEIVSVEDKLQGNKYTESNPISEKADIKKLSAEEILSILSSEQKNKLYISLRKAHVANDLRTIAKEEYDYNVTDDVVEDICQTYIDGKYDEENTLYLDEITDLLFERKGDEINCQLLGDN